MSLESAVQSDQPKLIGDLHSRPKPERSLFNQDTYAIEWILPHLPPSESSFFHRVMADIVELRRAELAQSDRFLNTLLEQRMGCQFRSRPDFARNKLAIEQWVPALDCWMVNGYFELGASYQSIITALEAGDPTKKTAEEELASRRELSAAKRESNERQSTDRVMDAVERLTTRQIENFVEVEQALHTGETITFRGDDRRRIDTLHEATVKAANQGDVESQAVLTRGQRDNPTCLLPSTNPLRHRHRSEKEGGL